MSQLHYIEVNKIDPHPDNPRKDNGDISELIDSIKANGVMQNLTLVPWFSEITRQPADDDKMNGYYRVVIGHRRLAAAKQAGLETVPCIITEMPPNEQLATMLLENMQRSDLTPYEQAQGFQLMLNMGESVTGISDKTGISESTVRRRMKLLELDSDKFKASEERGATLSEYLELEKLESMEQKNRVLESIGTSNFHYELKQALDAEKRQRERAAIIEKLESFAVQVESRERYQTIRNYYNYEFIHPEIVDVPEDAEDTNYFFYVDSYCIYLLKEQNEDEKEKDALEKAQREAAEDARKQRIVGLQEISERAFELRWDFVKQVSVAKIKKNMAAIIASSIWERVNSYSSFEDDVFFELMDIERFDAKGDDYDVDEERSMIVKAILSAPERAFFYAVYCDFEDSERNSYYQRWNGNYYVNHSLTYLYDMLEKLGYRMSDEERAMRDGTHKLFTTAPS